MSFYPKYDPAVSAAYAYGDENPQLLSVAEGQVAELIKLAWRSLRVSLMEEQRPVISGRYY